MYPQLLDLPGGFQIKTYGFFLMLAFLVAVWMAMRRAAKIKVDPDRVLDISFLCLLFGVGGARAFYVIHYWTPQFADVPNRLWAIVNITEGGLEFLGGFVGATLALVGWSIIRKQSLRLFLDIMAPGAMWGLAFGRIGCFFNGCCFGGVCETADHQPRYAWAVQFPFASPAHWREWEDRQVTVPAEFITTSKKILQPWLLRDEQLNMAVEKREGPIRRAEDLKKAYEKAKAEAPEAPETLKLKAASDTAAKAAEAHRETIVSILAAQRFPSRVEPSRRTSVSELQQLAGQFHSLHVHPTQLYAAAHALLLCGVLTALFYVRRRHGVVIGVLLVMYPIQRMVEELIRVDNPHDVAGLTISQFVGLSLFAVGVVYLYVIYRHLPERSPLADKARMPEELVP